MSDRLGRSSHALNSLLDECARAEREVLDIIRVINEKLQKAENDQKRLCAEIEEEYKKQAAIVKAQCDDATDAILSELKKKKRLLSESADELKERAGLELSERLSILEDSYSDAIERIDQQYKNMLFDAQKEYETQIATLMQTSREDERAGAASADAINKGIDSRLKVIEKTKSAASINVHTAIAQRGDELKRAFCQSASTVSTAPPLSSSLLLALSEYYTECEKEETLKNSYTTAADCTTYTFSDDRRDEIEAEYKLALADAARMRNGMLSNEKKKFENEKARIEDDVNEKYRLSADPAADYAVLKKKALEDIVSSDEKYNTMLDALAAKAEEGTSEVTAYVQKKISALSANVAEQLYSLAEIKTENAKRIVNYTKLTSAATDNGNGEVLS